MTQGTELPAGDPMRVPLCRAAVLAAFLCASAPLPAAPSKSSRDDDASLNRSMLLIATAFRAEEPDHLKPLLPGDGKIFLSLASLGGGSGYYSRDQVYFILNKVFSHHDTVKFGMRAQKESARERDPDKPGEHARFVNCVGSWSYHRHDGVDGENQIHFLLSLRKGAWSLVEIREAQ